MKKQVYKVGDQIIVTKDCGETKKGKVYEVVMMKKNVVGAKCSPYLAVNIHKNPAGFWRCCSCTENWRIAPLKPKKSEKKIIYTAWYCPNKHLGHYVIYKATQEMVDDHLKECKLPKKSKKVKKGKTYKYKERCANCRQLRSWIIPYGTKVLAYMLKHSSYDKKDYACKFCGC